ncbi:molybdopterin-dependent oxidoreductase, partial [Bacillus cereus]|uniref:molybdopterin-dependent oxidoreductase n=1 Tax=Bacillus cereus TaxID=1396 RepID=UPI002112C2DD
GKKRGMYVMGEEKPIVDSNANHVQHIIANIDFLVVQDMFLSKTAPFADVILPAAPSLEKEGTCTNTERRIHRLYEVLK